MTSTAATPPPELARVGRFTNALATGEVTGTWQGDITVTRAAGHAGEEVVVVADDDGQILLILSPTQGADLGETMHDVSGMATSTRGAQYLAQVYRENFVRLGISKARAIRETGISRRRLDALLGGSVPMTVVEHKALSEVGRP